MTGSPTKKSSWRLLSWRTALIAAIVLYTLVGFLVAPWIAKSFVIPKVSEQLGTEISVGKIRCNPYTLSLTLEGLSVQDRSGKPMLSLDELYINLQASSLFKWALVLKEFRVENPYAAVRRFPDKGINLLEIAEVFKSEEPNPGKEKGLPRAVLQAIRIEGGRFEIEDLAREDPFLLQAGPSQLHLNDISTIPGAEGDNAFVIGLPQGGTIRIQGDVVVEPLGLDGSLEFDKLVLANVWPAIANKFQFDMAGGNAAASLQYDISLEDNELRLRIDSADFELADLNFHTLDDQDLATVRSVAVTGVEAVWPDQIIRAESLVVDGADAAVWLNPDGTPSWADLVPKQTQEEIVETYEEVKDQIDIAAELGRFELRNGSVSFENRTFDEPHRIDVTGAELALSDISTEPRSEWGLAASASLGDESRAAAKGTFVALPVTLDVEVGLENLELSQFQAYVEQAAPLELLAGVLNTAGTVRLAPQDETGKIKFQGDLAIKNLDLDETVTGGTLIGWGDLKIDGIEATLAPMTLEVAKADVYSAGVEVAVAEDGSINLLQFTSALGGEKATAAEGETAAPAERETAETEESRLPPAEIVTFELHDCYGVYKDATTRTPFERKLESINGTISNITTRGEVPADLEINAGLDSGGAVTVTGRMDLLKYMRLTDLAVDVSQVQLPPMSPMSVKIIGYPIEKGRTSLDLDYQITDYQLQSTNHVEVYNLELGEKVEGEGKIKAPIKLGVSMLKDKNGQITLDVPMGSDLRDPEFVVGSAISAAIAGVAGELVKSPFRMLSRMVGGGDDQDLGYVDFPAGTSRLTPNSSTDLTTLAQALRERPDLSLEVAGVYNAEVDRAGLREAALNASFGVDTTADRPEAIALRRLESRYESDFSPSEAARVRGRFMSEDGSLDEQEYYDELWSRLLATQQSSEADVQALAPARAEAIRSFLIDQQGIDSSRVIVLPGSVEGETGDGTVRLQLSLNAE